MCRAQRALLLVRLNFALLVWLTPSRQTKKCEVQPAKAVLRVPKGHFYLCGSASCAQRALLPVRLNFALLVWLTPSRHKKMRSAACKGCASRAQRALLLVRLSFVNSLAAPSRHKKNAKCGAMHRASLQKSLRGCRGKLSSESSTGKKALPPHTLRLSPFRRRSGDRTVRGLCPAPGRHRE